MSKTIAIIAATLVANGCAQQVETEPELADLEDLCLQAEASLASCGTTGLDDFAAACMSDDSAEHAEQIAALASNDCAASSANEETEDHAYGTFVGACTTAILGAAAVMKTRNLFRSRGMTAEQKSLLRPYYGDLVDEVTVYWDSALLNDIEFLGYRMSIGRTYRGQTFGYNIYSRLPIDAPDAVANLAHELFHSRQARDRGGLIGFATSYCAGFWASDFDYNTNPMEIEAEEFDTIVLNELGMSEHD